jgi:hypothetical protein
MTEAIMSDMKITVEIDGKRHKAKVPFPHADHVLVSGVLVCPACGKATGEAGLVVRGSGNHIESHDTYKATAHAACCRRPIGAIRAKVSTIFGLEEDEAVLVHGRCRVY